MAVPASVRRLSPAAVFVLLMGIVSLLSDVTYEGARSLYGAYLPLLGASATAIGFISGLGEFLGYGLRWITGRLADRTGRYWEMTIAGYGMNLIAIPMLALVNENGWIVACGLILLERIGKAVRQPAKNTILSFAAESTGTGKAFAIQEFLDQLGAFLGPVMLCGILWLREGRNPLEAYALCFATLAIPSALALAVLLAARRKFPSPERLAPKNTADGCSRAGTKKNALSLYLVGAGIFAFGVVDFPLITMHAQRTGVFAGSFLPMLYAGAMLADAFAGLLFGWLFDRFGMRVLAVSVLAAAPSAGLVFCSGPSATLIAIGTLVWGIGMGAQETIFRAAVVRLTERKKRGSGFGTFESVFGLCWCAGSVCMGMLYDGSPSWLACAAVCSQLAAVPFCWKAGGAA